LSLGWGWGSNDQAEDNLILNNNIHDTMGLLQDGGSIYVNGKTISGCRMAGNWLWNYPAFTTANLYLDNGSSNWNCTNNLVIYTSATCYWLYIQVYAPTATDNTVANNYFENGAKMDPGPPSNKVYNNIGVIGSNWPPACIVIMSNAGPRSPYNRNLPHNLAFRRPVFASTTWSPGYAPSMVVDGDPATSWSPSPAAVAAWLEVDLLQSFVLTEVQILARRDNPYTPAWNSEFEIWASNFADMSKGHVVLGGQGPVAYPFRGLYRLHVTDPTAYRYVAVVKTDGSHNLSFAELRVF